MDNLQDGIPLSVLNPVRRVYAHEKSADQL